jgi:hypothetical protein
MPTDTLPRMEGRAAAPSAVVLTPLERWLLAIPLAGGVFFGLLPFLTPREFSTAVGYSGDDPVVARLAGAATFGYAVALFYGIRDGRWRSLRFVVLATLVFNVISIAACVIEIVAGRAQPVVYAITLADIVIIAVTWLLLSRYGAMPEGPRDVATYLVVGLVLATIAGAVFGLAPLLPKVAGPLFGYRGTDEFIYREAGAATFGYAVMGVWELRSLRWEELQLPVLMTFVFNALAFIAVLLELTPFTLGIALVGPASLAFAIGSLVVLIRRGR